mgnify:CR=1 FL=1
MAGKKEETASFVLRFNQKIFQNDQGEPQVQWRGNIRHVQGGEEKRFSEFDDVVKFIQTKLADLTIIAMEDKTPEEQKGILAKSFDMWKRMAMDGPKMVMETIKDPKKQVAQIQEQIQEQLHQVKEDIGEKLEIDSWRGPSKADYHQLMETLEGISGEITKLNKKVDKLAKKSK